MWLWSAVALLAFPTMVGAQEGGSPIRPANNPGAWITSADYPSYAIATGAEGTVAFKLQVEADGIVSSCEPVGGSAPKELKDLTCQLVSQRARFVPPRNASGDPLTGSYTATVMWQIPKEKRGSMPFPEEGSRTQEMVIEADGSVSSCTVEREKLLSAVQICEFPEGPVFQSFRDEDGKPVRKRVRTKTIVTIEDPDN